MAVTSWIIYLRRFAIAAAIVAGIGAGIGAGWMVRGLADDARTDRIVVIEQEGSEID